MRDLKKLSNVPARKQIANTIKHVEQANTLSDITSLKIIRGSEGYYRIRVGNYRIGIYVEGDVVTFVRALHRKEIYRYFP